MWPPVDLDSGGPGAWLRADPVRNAPGQETAALEALRRALEALGPGNSVELEQVARTALATSERLFREYQVVGPPLLHNSLVNMGLRKRGLCCHFAEDMLRALDALTPSAYRTYWLVAYNGDRFREHNTAAIGPAAGRWQDALVLDPWRHTRVLHHEVASADRYPWILHPLDAEHRLLSCP